MVWAAISLDGRRDLYAFSRGGISIITAAIYRNGILEPIVKSHAGAVGDAFI